MSVVDIQKWDYHTKSYQPYYKANGWRIACYVEDLDTVMQCASCGVDKPAGEMYSSQELHTKVGWAYNVCEKCHDYEMNRRREYGR